MLCVVETRPSSLRCFDLPQLQMLGKIALGECSRHSLKQINCFATQWRQYLREAAYCMGYWAKLVITCMSQEPTCLSKHKVFTIPMAFSFAILVNFNTFSCVFKKRYRLVRCHIWKKSFSAECQCFPCKQKSTADILNMQCGVFIDHSQVKGKLNVSRM